METMNWLPEHLAALQDLRARALPGRLDPPKPSRPKSPGVGRLREGLTELTPDLLRGPKIFTEAAEMPQLRCAAVVPRHLSLLDLKHGDRRYRYGGDSDAETMTFCGHPCRSGSRYCTPHFNLSRDPEATARPVLSAAWLRAIEAG